MSKRKKKGKRRRDAVIRTFGLGDAADGYEAAPLYQSRFQEGDMVWLAEEYQRRGRSEPSLTLEAFAAEYGVSADGLRVYVSDMSRAIDHSVILWHGTTASRARSILKEGFRAKKARNAKGRMFFTTKPSQARGIAQARSSGDDPPAVLMCSIDLSRYDDYSCREGKVYIFRHPCIAGDVVQRVERLPGERREKPERQDKHKDASDDFMDVALTFSSGRAGIAYWMNSYMKLDGSDWIGEDNEAVEKIKQWLDEQMDAGRFGEVPDDEILELLQEWEQVKEDYQDASQF